MNVVTLEDFSPAPRFDGVVWAQARIEESASPAGPWTALETVDLATAQNVYPQGLDTDSANPGSRDFTTTLATLAQGWYRIVWIDPSASEDPSPPILNSTRAAYTSVLGVRRALAPGGSQDATLGTAASLSDSDLQEAIEEAATEIDARIAARYILPLAEPVPALVVALNRDIAAYLATLTYRRGDPIDPNDPVQKRYDRAQSLLASIQSGKTELVVADGNVTSEQSEAVVINPYDGDMFTLDGFGIGETPYRVWPWEPV